MSPVNVGISLVCVPDFSLLTVEKNGKRGVSNAASERELLFKKCLLSNELDLNII